jgi:hypothetical protein
MVILKTKEVLPDFRNFPTLVFFLECVVASPGIEQTWGVTAAESSAGAPLRWEPCD